MLHRKKVAREKRGIAVDLKGRGFRWPYLCMETQPQLGVPVGLRKVILFYSEKDDYGNFSNFSKHPVYLKSKIWPTVEHYFQVITFLLIVPCLDTISAIYSYAGTKIRWQSV